MLFSITRSNLKNLEHKVGSPVFSPVSSCLLIASGDRSENMLTEIMTVRECVTCGIKKKWLMKSSTSNTTSNIYSFVEGLCHTPRSFKM